MKTLYGKAMLICYKNLALIINELDKLIYDSAISTHCMGGFAYGNNSALAQIEKVCKLIDKKNDLINLKLIMDTAMSKLPPSYVQLLSFKHFDNMSQEEMLKKLDISVRSLYRLYAKYLQSFAKQLFVMGYDDKWFEETYLTQSWINSTYKRCQNSPSVK